MHDRHNIPVDDLAKAIFTVNRHAKTAPQPQHLYTIKKEAINQLLQEQRAEKVGLHFSNNPKLSNQHSTLLVKIGNYFFHMPPTRNDFQELDHLGHLDENYRNPQTKMSLSHAKKIIYRYLDWSPPSQREQTKTKSYTSRYFTPSSLGKMKWPPANSSRY
ncbi:YkyB family protein [Lentibacillus saliphilus]|uniref:YkyB family protein n=1 Tax=Lentibacillus saliphilus TaxID=2737028 RepID=UPI001C2F17AB|nr:YkyB family protein [Lentibacillus saliphilus]